MLKTTTLFLLLTLALLAGGCKDLKRGPDSARHEELHDTYPQIAVLDKLGEYIAFTSPTVTSSPTEPLHVSVPIRLTSDQEVNAQYKFEFFQKDNRPVQPQMGWTYIKLPARAQVILEGKALDTNATNWRLLIRPAR